MLLCALQSRAVGQGASKLFGEALRASEAMRGLARKAGFAFMRSPDWRAVRLEREIR
jgi:hypothetical protein